MVDVLWWQKEEEAAAAAAKVNAAEEAAAVTVMLRAHTPWNESQGAAVGDLFFDAGDEFELVSDQEPGHGWWTGTHDGFVQGIFPANCALPSVDLRSSYALRLTT